MRGQQTTKMFSISAGYGDVAGIPGLAHTPLLTLLTMFKCRRERYRFTFGCKIKSKNMLRNFFHNELTTEYQFWSR